jgi:hypothetical protein
MEKGAGANARGIAKVRLSDGSDHEAEIHWYEASKIGQKEYKIKRFFWGMTCAIPDYHQPAKARAMRYPSKSGNYVSLHDPAAAKCGKVRVIDESGEDYLYPKAFSSYPITSAVAKGGSLPPDNFSFEL